MEARLATESREDAYRFYISDALYFNGQNKCWTVRFADLLNGTWKPPEPVDGDKLAEEVIRKAGLTMVEG